MWFKGYYYKSLHNYLKICNLTQRAAGPLLERELFSGQTHVESHKPVSLSEDLSSWPSLAISWQYYLGQKMSFCPLWNGCSDSHFQEVLPGLGSRQQLWSASHGTGDAISVLIVTEVHAPECAYFHYAFLFISIKHKTQISSVTALHPGPFYFSMLCTCVGALRSGVLGEAWELKLKALLRRGERIQSSLWVSSQGEGIS